MTRADIEKKFEEILAPVANKNGMGVYDVEYVKEGDEYYLRGYIENDDGPVTIDDCVSISRETSDLLDKDDFISDAYTLEISSPGLCRRLSKDKHFEKSIGEIISVKTFKAINNNKLFRGRLLSYDNKVLTIEAEDGNKYEFNLSETSLVKLDPDF